MAAEHNSFYRWRGSPTIGSDLKVIWEMSANMGVAGCDAIIQEMAEWQTIC